MAWQGSLALAAGGGELLVSADATDGHAIANDQTTAATSSFTVGAAFWPVRGGYIVASLISALPAWQTFDPIPILTYAAEEEGDEETIESLMES